MKRNSSLAVLTVVLVFVLAFGGCKEPSEKESGPSLPAAPSGLEVVSRTETEITISWDSVSGAAGYRIYAGTTAGGLTLQGSTTTKTIYMIQSLTPNATYYIGVSAVNGAGEGERSSTITVTTNQGVKPAAPSGLAAGAKTENSITVSWNSVSGVSGYNVYAGTTANNMTLKGNPTETSFTVTGLLPHTTYYIAVSARTASNESEQSTPISAATESARLTVGVVTENSIAVSWSGDESVSGYNVYAGITAANMELKGNATETNFTITGLSANTIYYIAISVMTGTQESNQSTPVSATTKPAAPAGLTKETITSSSIAVTWTSVSGISGYTVYAGTTSENMTQRGTPTAASFTITELTSNTLYYIAVSAVNVSGEGSKAAPITATTLLAAPGGLAANPIAASSTIQLSWNALVGAASYKVYRSTSETGTYSNIGTTSGQSYNDNTGITAGNNYYYKVSALTSGNVEGDLSGFIGGRIPTTTKAITRFGFVNFPSVNGTISGQNISVTVPNIVNLTMLVPDIEQNGKSISPEANAAQDFTSPKQYTVTADDGTFQTYTVTVTVTDTTLATAFSWLGNDARYGRTYTIVAQTNESLAPTTINVGYYRNVNIILSGGTTEKTISLSSNGSLFTISYGTLTLENNITLSGRGSNNASLVRVSGSAALVMKTGSKIQNNTVATANNTDALGGGVCIINGGTFTMDGGTISGNKVQAGTSGSYSNTTVRAKGGGVCLYNGTFVMNGGTISSNTAYSAYYPSAGGGVYVESGEEFTMNDGTISGNTAETSAITAVAKTYGGGVAAWDSSKFTMTGGTISGNDAKLSGGSSSSTSQGGGVYIRSDKFTKTGGTIYGSNASPANLQNTAKDTNSGHAVYVMIGSTSLKRNTTAGTAVNMNSSTLGSAGGWE